MNKLFSRLVVLFTLLLNISAVSVYSQTLSSKEWKAIQKSGDYIIGMGMSESMDHARQVAMGDLVGKISTDVETRFDFVLTNKDGKKSKGQMEKIIKTYSSTRLDNVKEYVAKDHGKYVIYRYISNSDLEKMFQRRINMAKKWAKDAIDREKEGKIGDALQDFYWSLALLRSCPDGDLETITKDYEEQNMMIDVRERVNNILENVKVKAVSLEKEGHSQRLYLSVLYKDKPVTNFNYKYTDGKISSELFSAKDGVGELLVPSNAKLKKLKIKAEYEFRDEANIQPELRSVIESLDPVPFRAAMLDVDASQCVNSDSREYAMVVYEGESIQKPSPALKGFATTGQSIHVYSSTMDTIEKGIANRDYSGLEQYFTSEGWDMFSKLIKYGDAKLLRSPEVQFTPNGKGMVCRSFPMSFTFGGNKRTFVENVVFYLDENGKVCEVAFGLEKTAVDDIMQRGPWSEEARMVMVHFLDTYKTAYALKRLDYIRSIFSDDALIITGSIVKSIGRREFPVRTEYVKYTRQTKEQYIRNLERCFMSNEYINIHFADNKIRRSGTYTNMYGIQINQTYYSSTYGDTGYLFLLIDFSKPGEPLIHVRAWQPDNNPNVRDGRLKITDFTGE